MKRSLSSPSYSKTFGRNPPPIQSSSSVSSEETSQPRQFKVLKDSSHDKQSETNQNHPRKHSRISNLLQNPCSSSQFKEADLNEPNIKVEISDSESEYYDETMLSDPLGDYWITPDHQVPPSERLRPVKKSSSAISSPPNSPNLDEKNSKWTQIPRICPYCPKVQKNIKECRQHILNSHPGEKVICSYRFRCEKCQKTFTRLQPFEHHQKKACVPPALSKYICQICGSNYKSNYELEVHMMIHQEGKPHVCETCRSVHKTAWHLQIHYQKSKSCDPSQQGSANPNVTVILPASTPPKASEEVYIIAENSSSVEEVGVPAANLQCVHCNDVYYTSSLLLHKHSEKCFQLQKHKKSLLKCTFCYYATYDLKVLARHSEKCLTRQNKNNPRIINK